VSKPVYVVGHLNPDTDSVCSAIGYAGLKNREGSVEAVACRAGKLNPETEYVLNYFKVDPPIYLADVRARAEDMLDGGGLSVSPDASLKRAWELAKQGHVRSLPVVDPERHLIGLVTVDDLAEKILTELEKGRDAGWWAGIEDILGTRVQHMMKEKDLVYFEADDLVSDIRNVMLDTRFRQYPVVDDQNRLMGTISRYHLLALSRKQVILVDHNEKSQAVEGIAEAEVLEVIDHHRLADVQTGEPIYVRNEPVGSTATIVTGIYRERDLTPDKATAGILCAAVLSDTLLFKSPTCTCRDRQVARELAALAGINPDRFGRDMFRAGSALTGRPAEEVFYEDFKEFHLGEYLIGIGQAETVDLDIEPVKESLLQVMEGVARGRGYDLVLLMLTDLLREGTELLVAGDYKLVEKAFGVKVDRAGVFLPGVMSRKKQVVPPLSRLLFSGGR